MTKPALPSPELLYRQAEWLAPARGRLLRQAGIAQRKLVLDLGCGHGAVCGELSRRCGGRVIALDCQSEARADRLVCGLAEQLPVADAACDLVFCQFAMMWMDAAAVVREVRRVLTRGGALAAIEPDYGGMIEHPPEIITRELWLAALRRAGADPCIGRKLPGLLAVEGFRVQVDLLDRLVEPSPERFDFLRSLPLEDCEQAALARIEAADARLADSPRVAHLPVFMVLAERL